MRSHCSIPTLLQNAGAQLAKFGIRLLLVLLLAKSFQFDRTCSLFPLDVSNVVAGFLVYPASDVCTADLALELVLCLIPAVTISLPSIEHINFENF